MDPLVAFLCGLGVQALFLTIFAHRILSWKPTKGDPQ